MTTSASRLKSLRLAMAIGAALAACPLLAQEVDHSTMDHSMMHHPAPPQPEPEPENAQPAREARATSSMQDGETANHATPVQEDAALHPAAKDEANADAVDHSGMDHAAPGSGHGSGEAVVEPTAEATDVDSGMDHSSMDHSSMAHDGGAGEASVRGEPVAEPDSTDHSEMDHSSHVAGRAAPVPASGQPREPIPELSDADRRAAFPDLAPHPAHGESVHSYFLANRLEAWDADHGTGTAWEMQAWIGKDLERLWVRSEGERSGGETEAADIELLYGRSVSPWWEVVAGVRHDFAPGEAQSHLAIGVMGLAPQWFEIEATAYLSEHGRLSARIEAEYELLITNRLILQPLIEASLQGGNDPERGIGSGLGTVEAGLRLRYEFTRRFAPYIGLVHERAFGETADYRRDAGESAKDTRVVAGVRIWF